MPVTQVLKGYRNHRYYDRTGSGISQRILYYLQLSESEIFEALEQGLKLAEETGADLMLATDPDADRVGWYCMKCPMVPTSW